MQPWRGSCTARAAQSHPTLLPPDSGASPSSAPCPLWELSSPQGSFPSPAPVLVPEAGREAFLAELVLQHLGKEHRKSYSMVIYVLSVLYVLPSSRGAKQSHLLTSLRFLLPNISLLTLSYPDLTVPQVLLEGSSGTVSQLSEFSTNVGINSCSGRENVF